MRLRRVLRSCRVLLRRSIRRLRPIRARRRVLLPRRGLPVSRSTRPRRRWRWAGGHGWISLGDQKIIPAIRLAPTFVARQPASAGNSILLYPLALPPSIRLPVIPPRRHHVDIVLAAAAAVVVAHPHAKSARLHARPIVRMFPHRVLPRPNRPAGNIRTMCFSGRSRSRQSVGLSEPERLLPAVDC